MTKYFIPAALTLILVILALMYYQQKQQDISPTKLTNGACKQTNGDIQGLPLQ